MLISVSLPIPTSVSPAVLARDIETLGLPERLYGPLRTQGVREIWQLLSFERNGVLNVKGLPRKSQRELGESLRASGLPVDAYPRLARFALTQQLDCWSAARRVWVFELLSDGVPEDKRLLDERHDDMLHEIGLRRRIPIDQLFVYEPAPLEAGQIAFLSRTAIRQPMSEGAQKMAPKIAGDPGILTVMAVLRLVLDCPCRAEFETLIRAQGIDPERQFLLDEFEVVNRSLPRPAYGLSLAQVRFLSGAATELPLSPAAWQVAYDAFHPTLAKMWAYAKILAPSPERTSIEDMVGLVGIRHDRCIQYTDFLTIIKPCTGRR